MSSNSQGIEYIYTEYGGKIKSYIMSRVSNTHDAEDLYSEVFLKIAEHFDSYDAGKSSYSTWVYVITQNTVRDYFRRSQHNQSVELSDEMPLADLSEDIEDKLLNDEVLQALSAALEKLSERERDIIILRFYRGMPAKDVAIKMNISYANVRYIQSIALKKLRGLMPNNLL